MGLESSLDIFLSSVELYQSETLSLEHVITSINT